MVEVMAAIGKTVLASLLLSALFLPGLRTMAAEKSVNIDQAKFSNLGIYLPTPRATPARLLNCPADKSYGGIIVCDRPHFVLQNQEGDCVNFKAQGTVKIPANKFVLFAPNANFIASPHALDSLPANAFDGVIFRFMAMEDKDDGKGDPALAALNHFTSLRSLDLQKAEISDRGLAQLKDLTNLEYLGLFSTEVRGDFLKANAGLKNLRVLLLSHDGLDLSCLKCLSRYPQLVQLNLCRTKLTPAAAQPLAQCLNLRALDISDNPQIDDSVASVLMPLKKLEHLRMNNTKITDRTLRQLMKAGIRAVGTDAYDSTYGRSQAAAESFKTFTKGRAVKRADMETIFGPMSRGRGL